MGHGPGGTAKHGGRPGCHGRQTPDLFCPGTGMVLALLDRGNEALQEGQDLLAGSTNRLFPLLVLARVLRSHQRWQEAARLHKEALRLAATPIREATVRHQIGTRFFQEGRYRDAAAEFEWARDLFRSWGHRDSRTQASEQAMHRARELALQPLPTQRTGPDQSRGTKNTSSGFSRALPWPRPTPTSGSSPPV